MKQAYLRWTASLIASLMLFGVAGCGQPISGESRRQTGGGMDRPMSRNEQPYGQQRQGMSTKQKVMLVAGAAALYYLYNKHKNRQGEGAQGQYYRSKNGRIYYRDRNGKAVWVTAPSEPIAVPAEEWERYSGRSYQGQEGRVIREAPDGSDYGYR